MIKRRYRSGGGIREAKPAPQVDLPEPTPDLILEGLNIPLDEQASRRIRELDLKGVPRTQIARQLGIPKVRVTHELVLQAMKPVRANKFVQTSYERSSTI